MNVILKYAWVNINIWLILSMSLYFSAKSYYISFRLLLSTISTYASVLLLSALCVIMYCLNVLPYIFLQKSTTFHSDCSRYMSFVCGLRFLPALALSFLCLVHALFLLYAEIIYCNIFKLYCDYIWPRYYVPMM